MPSFFFFFGGFKQPTQKTINLQVAIFDTRPHVIVCETCQQAMAFRSPWLFELHHL